jgi:hypothetical protein
MLNKYIIKFSLVLGLFLVTLLSNAFWIGFAGIGYIHQYITTEGLNNYTYHPIAESYQSACGENGCKHNYIDIAKLANIAVDGKDEHKVQDNYVDVEGRIVTESYLNTKSIPRFHCDDEDIYNCSALILNGSSTIVNKILTVSDKLKLENRAVLTQEESAELFKTTNIVLGQISHTLQDFYSHTNWVEMQLYPESNETITLYSYVFSVFQDILTENVIGIHPTLGKADFKYARSFNSTCTTTASQTNLQLSSLTSGYYQERPDIYGFSVFLGNNIFGDDYSSAANNSFSDVLNHNGPYYGPYPDGIIQWSFEKDNDQDTYRYDGSKPQQVVEKCQHGDFRNNSTIGAGGDDHFGIAKDQPGRKNHHVAMLAAKDATTDLIKTIIGRVIEKDNSQYAEEGILAFLGYKNQINKKIRTSVNNPEEASYTLQLLNSSGVVVRTYESNLSLKALFDNVELNLSDFPYSIRVVSEGYESTTSTCEGYPSGDFDAFICQPITLVRKVDTTPPQVTSKIFNISPLTATVNKLTTFTISGEELVATITFQLDGADCQTPHVVTETRIDINCTPGTAGESLFHLTTSSGESIEGSAQHPVIVTEYDSLLTIESFGIYKINGELFNGSQTDPATLTHGDTIEYFMKRTGVDYRDHEPDVPFYGFGTVRINGASYPLNEDSDDSSLLISAYPIPTRYFELGTMSVDFQLNGYERNYGEEIAPELIIKPKKIFSIDVDDSVMDVNGLRHVYAESREYYIPGGYWFLVTVKGDFSSSSRVDMLLGDGYGCDVKENNGNDQIVFNCRISVAGMTRVWFRGPQNNDFFEVPEGGLELYFHAHDRPVIGDFVGSGGVQHVGATRNYGWKLSHYNGAYMTVDFKDGQGEIMLESNGVGEFYFDKIFESAGTHNYVIRAYNSLDMLAHEINEYVNIYSEP